MVSIKGSVGIGDLLKSIALGWLKNSLQTGSRGKDSLHRVLGVWGYYYYTLFSNREP